MVFNLIFKNNLLILDNLRIYILYTILFRSCQTHLAGHVLKETVLIFLMISFIYFRNIFKNYFLSLSVFIKKYNFLFIIFYLDNLIKKFLTLKIKFIFYTISIIVILFIFFYELNILIKTFNRIFFLIKSNLFSQLKDGTIEIWLEGNMIWCRITKVLVPLGFFLKIITWRILIFSGFFCFY